MPDLIYLAAPYSHHDREVVQRRVLEINIAAAFLFQRGYFVFSPISHTHPIKECSGLGGGWAFWSAYDYAMLDKCDRLMVLMLAGWDISVGVQAEIAYWREKNRKVEYLSPLNYQITETYE
jgi:hypothetical protein